MNEEVFLSELKKREADLKTALAAIQQQQADLAAQATNVMNLLDHVQAIIRSESGQQLNASDQDSPSLFPSNDLAGLSVNEAIQRLLAEVGRPMHAFGILDALRRRGVRVSEKDPKATIVTALVRGVKRGTYVRTAPNTYGLARITTEDGEGLPSQ